jgi:hypothetical protein
METILIQESDEAILDIVSTALEMEGYHVCSLSDQHEIVIIFFAFKTSSIKTFFYRFNDDFQYSQMMLSQIISILL